MTFDLAAALHRKEEYETSRLVDFAFRVRARATRALAGELGLDMHVATALLVRHDEAGVCAALAAQTGRALDEVTASYRLHHAAAARALVVERGDPSPHRLA
ncbi:hypothetical protein M9979_03255 [Sphingomonas sp. RP10(2022)]|uniref:Uncharacterized protein n=1 Tax=Sphingomonas liriopis TaxID=2949094 RepID=A0A9X2HW80_9SPHN|nr:hypothetical protein [Sphingomonas liriopis]MCP3733895.1 hypothetical protein [Sphingomonas liriopis]